MDVLQDIADRNRADHARLTGLSKTADEAHITLQDAAQRAVDTAIDIGERLLTAQDHDKPGFYTWLEQTHPFKKPMAIRYMRIAAHKTLARQAVADGKWPGINALVKSLPERDEKRPSAPVRASRLAYTGSAVKPRAATEAGPAPDAGSHEPETERETPEQDADRFGNDSRIRSSPAPRPAATSTPTEAPRDGDDWHTPAEYVEAARKVMGSIDFDPFSGVLANRVVKAKRFFTKADDALVAPWSDTDQRTCWMNPPYSRGMSGRSVDRFLDQYDYGAFDQAVVLMNASTDTNWFHRLAKTCTALCFTNFRIAFDNTDGKTKSNNTKGQVFFYFGKNPETFKDVFSAYGIVLDTKGMRHG